MESIINPLLQSEHVFLEDEVTLIKLEASLRRSQLVQIGFQFIDGSCISSQLLFVCIYLASLLQLLLPVLLLRQFHLLNLPLLYLCFFDRSLAIFTLP